MTPQEFQTQMNRLVETYGDKNYPPERRAILFDTVKEMPSKWFEGVTTEFIGNMRTPPLQKEFNDKKLQQIERDKIYRGYRYGESQADTSGILNQAARRNKKADPEFVKFCMEVVQKKLSGKMNQEQFLQACGYLDDWAKSIEKSHKTPEKPRKDWE